MQDAEFSGYFGDFCLVMDLFSLMSGQEFGCAVEFVMELLIELSVLVDSVGVFLQFEREVDTVFIH